MVPEIGLFNLSARNKMDEVKEMVREWLKLRGDK
jgi:hypothetical protein